MADIVDKLIYGSDLPTKMELDSRYILAPILQEAAETIIKLRVELDRLRTVIYLNREKIDGGYAAAKDPNAGE